MKQKNELLITVLKSISEKSSAFGVTFVVCGGLGIHILSDYFGRRSSRPWNHKDIDLMVPLSQLSSAIAFFKNIGFLRAFVPSKKARLVKNHYRFSKTVEGQKILVDIYGVAKIPILRIPWKDQQFPVISPKVELENWVDRKSREGSRPSVELSIKFLESIVENGNYTEEVVS